MFGLDDPERIVPCWCGHPKPKHTSCADCGRPWCEWCADLIDGELVCHYCMEKRTEDVVEEEIEAKRAAFEAREAAARAEVMRHEPSGDLSWFYRWLDAPKGVK